MKLDTATLNTDGSISLCLPVPHRALTLNGRGHWRTKHTLTQGHKQAAFYIVRDALTKAGCPWPRAEMSAVFYFSQPRGRDDDNFSASLKPYRDGVALAGLVKDDKHIKYTDTTFEVGTRRVEITFRRVDT